jgi:hypothetical protein
LFVDHELKADEGRVGPHDHLTRAEVLALLPTSPSWPSRDSKADRDRGRMRLLNAAKLLDWLADHPRRRVAGTLAGGRRRQREGLQVSFDAAMAKLNSLKRAPTDGRPQLVDLGMPVFTDHAPLLQPGSGEPGYRP